MCQRVEVGISSTTGWGLGELDRLPARRVFAYATACIEQQARELAREIDVSLISVEAFGGGSALGKRLRRQLRRMLGDAELPAISDREQSAIAEVEREIVREFPFYFDEARLNEVHQAIGRLRLG